MKFFLFLSLFLLVSQETLDDYDVEYEENYKVCSSLVDETSCLNKVLESNIFYCCYVSSDVPESNSCVVTDKANLEIFKNEKLTALYRESNGYEDAKEQNFEDGSESNYIQKYKCKDGEFETNSNLLVFSTEEKETLASKEHCLYLHNYYIEDDRSATKEICQNGKLTKNATDKGLKCGYFDITFKLKNKNENYKTCYLVNPDDITSGKFNSLTKKLFDQYALMISGGDDAVNYTFDVSVGNDISGSYDSEKGKMVNNKSVSSMIRISKFLSLLLLLLNLF